jgi:hypothetical protein
MGFNLAFKGLNAQHVSSDTSLIIRSSKTVIAAFGFTSVCACRPQPHMYVKPEAAITVFELLVMSGVSLGTC